MRRFGLAACAAVLLWSCGSKGNDDAKASVKQETTKKDDDDDTPPPGPGVTLKKDAQERAGLKVEALAEHPVQAELVAYGKLEEDPSSSFVVRAPYSGTLRLAAGQSWPSIGQTLPAHAGIGQIEPRLQLTDRVTLNTQLTAARAELNSSQTAAAAAQTAFDRAKALNADNKNISDRALQEAAAKLAAEQARENGARATLQTIEGSLSSAVAGGTTPISPERGGDVVEVLAQPGESVEQGAALVRLTQLDHLLTRIDLPVGETLPAQTAPVRVVASGFENQSPVPAERVSIASADPHAQGITLLYRLSRVYAGMRPGMAVTARIALPGRKAEGVLIPRSAIVQQDGRLWVYVQTSDDHFSRKPVPLDVPAADGYLAARGFAPGDRVVITGAQTLLSEEFKSQNEADTN